MESEARLMTLQLVLLVVAVSAFGVSKLLEVRFNRKYGAYLRQMGGRIQARAREPKVESVRQFACAVRRRFARWLLADELQRLDALEEEVAALRTLFESHSPDGGSRADANSGSDLLRICVQKNDPEVASQNCRSD
jgi:hypothetical protein